jgi:hypothetical protein
MHIYSGISAPVTPGGTQSLFAIWSFQNSKYLGRPTKENEPRPLILFQNPGNGPNNPSGQRRGISTRRYSHRMIATLNGKYVHVFDSLAAQTKADLRVLCELIMCVRPFWLKATFWGIKMTQV